MSANWQDAMTLKRDLIGRGWKTPDTYGNEFAPVPKGHGIYLFLIHRLHEYDICCAAYVGMSKQIMKRWQAHNILKRLHADGYYTQRWFLSVPMAALAQEERKYIREFDPALNIHSKVSGI